MVVENNYFETELCLAFTGKKVDKCEIDALTFSKSLEALHNLFIEANRVVNAEYAEIEVEIVASFEEGSFQFWIKIKQKSRELTKDLFGKKNLQRNADIATILGFIILAGQSTTNLIEFLISINNSPIQTVTPIDDKTVEIDCGGKKIKIPIEIFKLQEDMPVRRNLEAFVSPICKEGIDSIESRKNKKAIQKIEKKDFFSLRAPNINQVISEEEYSETYTIVRPDILHGNEWRLKNDFTGKSFTAKILDTVFINDVHNGKYEFTSGDKLNVHIKEIVLETKRGQETRYEVLKVHRHIKAS